MNKWAMRKYNKKIKKQIVVFEAYLKNPMIDYYTEQETKHELMKAQVMYAQIEQLIKRKRSTIKQIDQRIYEIESRLNSPFNSIDIRYDMMITLIKYKVMRLTQRFCLCPRKQFAKVFVECYNEYNTL